MTPEQLANSDTESAHQTALFAWAALNFNRWPKLRWMHHIPNGGSRGDDERTRKIRGGRLKAEGVRDGIPDIFLPVACGQYHGLYIEMKRPAERPKRDGSKGSLSDAQLEFAHFAIAEGYAWAVCYAWNDAAALIERYLNE